MPTTEPAAPSSTQPPLRRTRIRRWVTLETTSGGLLLAAAVIALVWANSPWRDGYSGLASLVIGPAELHLDLALATWATDGLLTVFFFVVGIELKHELVAGSLRNAREASVPVIAAVGGMAVPAVFYLVVVLALDDRTALHGWAIPTATDIAFALAVLSVFGRGLPRALRTFLLTLAVVDDLLAIVIIAVAYSSGVDLVQLGAAIATVGVFALVVRMRRAPWWVLVPIAVIAWWFMHLSGVHATIAGVLLGLSVPARAVHREADPRTRRFDDAVRPSPRDCSARVRLLRGGSVTRREWRTRQGAGSARRARDRARPRAGQADRGARGHGARDQAHFPCACRTPSAFATCSPLVF